MSSMSNLRNGHTGHIYLCVVSQIETKLLHWTGHTSIKFQPKITTHNDITLIPRAVKNKLNVCYSMGQIKLHKKRHGE